MDSCGSTRKPAFRRGWLALSLTLAFLAACAPGRYTANESAGFNGTGGHSAAFPRLWNGESERAGYDVDAASFNAGTNQIGDTRVDYIGELNEDQTYEGSPAQEADQRLLIQAGASEQSGEGYLSVEFENDTLDYFVQQMLGGFLGLNYVVSGELGGSVKFKTERPIPRSQALAVVRSILARDGFVLKLVGGVFHIATAQTLQAMEQANRAGSRGDRLSTVIPLSGRADESLPETIRAIVPNDVSVVLSPAGNSMIITAPPHQLGDVRQLVSTLISGDSPRSLFAIIYLHNSPPQNVASKLLAFFATQKGNENKLPVSVIPLEERQALLVAASTPAAIENVRKLASKLDFGLNDEITLRLIPLRHLGATEIAGQLSTVFGAAVGNSAIQVETTGQGTPEVDLKLASVPAQSDGPLAESPSGQSVTTRINQAFEERPEARRSPSYPMSGITFSWCDRPIAISSGSGRRCAFWMCRLARWLLRPPLLKLRSPRRFATVYSGICLDSG